MMRTLIEEAAAGEAEIIGLTVDQYDYMIEHGLLDEDTSTELIEGFIVRKDRARAGENPVTIGDRHTLVVQRFVRMAPMFDPYAAHLRFQQPIVLPPKNEPEPDVAVTRETEDDFAGRKPGVVDVYAVIEVADHSLGRDLGVKLRAYASAGIPQYVVVDLVHDVVLDHANPASGSYPPPNVLRRGDVLRISAGGGDLVDVAVDRLLAINVQTSLLRAESSDAIAQPARPPLPRH
jgi:hypothetical protein